ncbi:MAG TPA: winged helix-turn-helix transcriptional regulator [Methanothermococcus okinawensis]|uniref:Winged helix-turn-helix transcriptional regulator n=1 Tax=Methanothermococcus okinawensis TaxID=155863 RepID=A0A833E1U6_9EURY|nr:winged helix-turn-helix transcriptional regulator [Methanococcaceae archaeon]HIP84577.1 winged helix-turn-helix transcriptional regulator [Methanothermococcus okinawensis]HIP91320.1 winged helix-turn-helix transcriptional regulator [Methanothermococcus okinawensis]
MKKRNITELQILSEIVRKQPHIKQKEIADALGITVQGVSEHIRNLLKKGYIKSRGRGKYVLTDKGIRVLKNWISQFRDYLEEVNREIYRYKDIWPAIAYEDIEEGDRVYLFMRRGLLYASKTVKTSSTAEVVEGGREGEDIAITNIEGIIEMKRGKVIVVKVPPRVNGGSKNVNYCLVREVLDKNRDAVVASMGTVSYVVCEKLGVIPEIRFAVLEGIVKACDRGCDIICLVTGRMTERVVKVLDSNKIKYTVLDATRGSY